MRPSIPYDALAPASARTGAAPPLWAVAFFLAMFLGEIAGITLLHRAGISPETFAPTYVGL